MSHPNVDPLIPVYEAWNRGDWSVGAELFDEHILSTTAHAEGQARFTGVDRIVSFLRDFLQQWDRCWVKAGDVRAEDDWVLVTGRQFGTAASAEMDLEAPMYNAWRFRHGLAVELHFFFSLEPALAVLGLSE